MSSVAIVGAGPIGSAIAHWLAERARFRAIRFIDASVNVAAGKALDLRQSGPIAGVDVDLTATGDVLAAAGASVIVIADAIDGGEIAGRDRTRARRPRSRGRARLRRSCLPDRSRSR